MKIKLALGAVTCLASASAFGAQIGLINLSGFAKDEVSVANNVAPPATNCFGDTRGVLGTAFPGCGAPTTTGTVSTPTPMIQVTASTQHEFDSGWTVDGRLTKRIRNGSNDIVGQYWFDKNIGVSYPTFGTIRVGTQLARAWSRQDAFSYPIGLSSPWSESGAGFGLFPQSIRYTTPQINFSLGKLTLEATYATETAYDTYFNKNPPVPVDTPTPQMLELFAQFSNQKNLIELTLELSHGGAQSSWGKSPFVGAPGDPQTLPGTTTGRYSSIPRQSVAILEGDHWFNPQWMLTWGVRHSYWSGAALTCDYAVQYSGCVYNAGFNYSGLSGINPGYAANVNDFLLGISHYHGLWTYTAGMVYLGKAKTDNPTEWGQSNSAIFTNLGIYRKVPELYRNLSIYGGLGYVHFGRLGPAPLSMPSNTAFAGIDPRTTRSGESVTLGVLVTF
ncbi:MAG: hypothetical protein HIU89_01880 [Proteobacteria bacterium]|nr:hypothetical protein [Pseudomonadota bacterium]